MHASRGAQAVWRHGNSTEVWRFSLPSDPLPCASNLTFKIFKYDLEPIITGCTRCRLPPHAALPGYPGSEAPPIWAA